nr:uncharacterized protein LOC111508927 [Leptinotarsa decemlineata]
MKVTISPNGSCNVSYIKTHLGHQNDLRHLTLTRSDKKLLSGASVTTDLKFCDIFEEEEVPVSSSNEKVEKLHLANQKDLSNIETAFDCWGTSYKDNEIININSWVDSTGNGSKALYYKPPNRVNMENAELERGDYLIFMNEAQSEILRRFGQDCICIDQTHETNSNGFHLITLFVVDSMRQGFPCAFLLCSRTDQAAITTFFNFVREQVGILMPKVFMADIEEFLYDLWVSVMGSPDRRLFCSWHVDHAWRDNLNRITSQEKKEETYNLLRRLLLIERDTNTCNITIYEAFNRMLADPDAGEFASYFKDNFSQNIEYWAYCYRLDFGLNANTHLEKLHKIFEYIYLDERNCRRLDKCLFVLMRFIKDQLFDRLVKHRHCVKIPCISQTLKERHAASLDLEFANIIRDNNGWRVSSLVGGVSSVKVEDAQCRCSLRCKECDICLHKYSCSCLDNSVNWNMCKHIHLVCRFLQNKTEFVDGRVGDTSSLGDISIDYNDFGDSEEFISITPEVSKTEGYKKLFAEEKDALCRQFRELVRGVSSPDDLQTIKKCISRMKHELKGVCSKKKVET